MSASESRQESPMEAPDSSSSHMEVDENQNSSVAASPSSETAPTDVKTEADSASAAQEDSSPIVKDEASENLAESPKADENNSEGETNAAEAANSDENDAGSEDNNDESTGAANAPEIDPIYQQTLLKPIFERREKSLKELLGAMDEFSPIIPDAVTDYYLTRAGFHSSDVRVKRLLALATQKFVADIANDAYQYSRVRAQSGGAPGGPGRSRAGPGPSSGRTVLTMESLSGVLEDYGVNAQRPDFFH